MSTRIRSNTVRRTIFMPGLMLMTVALSATLSGCGPLSFTVGGSPADNALRSTVVMRDGHWGSNRVAIIDVAGLLADTRKLSLFSSGENPVSSLAEQLNRAAADGQVKAVILRMNTPGGTVTASDMMYRKIKRFERATHKPVVVLMADVAASGGYYVACAADDIVAYPTSITGSIGVVFQTISVADGLRRIGVKTDAIVSGPNKEAGSLLSDMTAGQRAILQSLVNDFYQRFRRIVRKARPSIPASKFDKLTDGRVVTGKAAVKLGLADQNGGLPQAIAQAKRLAGIKEADVVIYHRKLKYVGSAYAMSPIAAPRAAAPTGATGDAGEGRPQVNLMQLNMNIGHALALDMPAGFYYVWQPGE